MRIFVGDGSRNRFNDRALIDWLLDCNATQLCFAFGSLTAANCEVSFFFFFFFSHSATPIAMMRSEAAL